jgi:hypothetical protein
MAHRSFDSAVHARKAFHLFSPHQAAAAADAHDALDPPTQPADRRRLIARDEAHDVVTVLDGVALHALLTVSELEALLAEALDGEGERS